MDAPIELQDMDARRQAIQSDERDTKRGGRVNMDTDQEQAVTLWAYVASILLLIIAVPMMLFPTFLLYLSETSFERRNALTPLESFLALHSGILLSAFALALVFNAPSNAAIRMPNQDEQAHPLLVPLTSACGLMAFISYNTTSVGSLAMLVFLGSATIAVWGIWTILFSGTSYISRKTGADKRTSRFLFGNKAAASSQKKEWKRQQERPAS